MTYTYVNTTCINWYEQVLHVGLNCEATIKIILHTWVYTLSFKLDNNHFLINFQATLFLHSVANQNHVHVEILLNPIKHLKVTQGGEKAILL